MFGMIHSIQIASLKAQKPCGGVIVCAGQVGQNQAAAHAINPRDPGRPGFM